MRAQQSVTMIATMGLSQAARGGANGARPRTRQKVGLGPRRANSPMRGRAPPLFGLYYIWGAGCSGSSDAACPAPEAGEGEGRASGMGGGEKSARVKEAKWPG